MLFYWHVWRHWFWKSSSLLSQFMMSRGKLILDWISDLPLMLRAEYGAAFFVFLKGDLCTCLVFQSLNKIFILSHSLTHPTPLEVVRCTKFATIKYIHLWVLHWYDWMMYVIRLRVSEWVIKFNSLFGDNGHQGPYSPERELYLYDWMMYVICLTGSNHRMYGGTHYINQYLWHFGHCVTSAMQLWPKRSIWIPITARSTKYHTTL